uniref:Ribosomal RNA methyltransferase FtsJ domain-containing protein n=1 Tax=Hanusia phi TaxID=3032 RepID=A0A7S0EGX8_9CRYP|mmetsp:Transcript_24317/g.54757  ORF Transcript_24317/g.54757 Transcript_24317/m.54757 type:complete len:345 (+) Transcript_24317:1-1035(+)
MQAVMAAAAVAMLWLQGSRGSGSCRSCFAPCSRLFRAQGNVLPSLRSCWCKSAKGPGWVTPARSLAQGSPGGETSNHVDPATNGGETTDKFLNKKIRVDELLVELGLASDMKHASALVMAGAVIIDETVRVKSPAHKLRRSSPIRLKAQKEHPWVSRGGMKLDHAIKEFAIEVKDVVAVDVGCSTGGFTHVLLHHGAWKVYAVDVGYGQLDLQMRQNPRVVVLERTNARNLTEDIISDTPSMIVCDASFIPLHKVLPASLKLCRPPAVLLALIKPQFEALRHEVESGTGVVRDGKVHERVCSEVSSWLESVGWKVQGITQSPITGPNGNVEFIIYATLQNTAET